VTGSDRNETRMDSTEPRAVSGMSEFDRLKLFWRIFQLEDSKPVFPHTMTSLINTFSGRDKFANVKN
jgi:hypothetical protein